jgi:hypothetical protein
MVITTFLLATVSFQTAKTRASYYDPDESEPQSTAVVRAVAEPHDEDMIDQKWLVRNGSNTDALDLLFQEDNLNVTLQFEADGTTATIIADESGNPRIKIESHR